MTEKDISTILEHAVPVEPGLTGLGDRVRDGHRRRRMVRAGVVVVGALALGVPVALSRSMISLLTSRLSCWRGANLREIWVCHCSNWPSVICPSGCRL